MTTLLHPTYFPNVAHFVKMVKSEFVVFEYYDNYQKQTYRNRTCIYAANGKLSLNIPVNYSQVNREFYRDVQIANIENWQSNHWKSITSAYNTSPFFEYYKDELISLFKTKFENLYEFNMACIQAVLDCLQFKVHFQRSSAFEKKMNNTNDWRHLVLAKKEPIYNLEPYFQVFSTKYGFIENLSILDVLFNLGPDSINYLKSQDLG